MDDACWTEFEHLLQEEEHSAASIAQFKAMFDQYLTDPTAYVDWSNIQKLDIGSSELLEFSSICTDASLQHGISLLKQLAVIKLNGGLGTSMGLSGPKSILQVKGRDHFLSLTVKQVLALNKTYGTDIPLVFMNSLNTISETKAALGRLSELPNSVLHMVQHRFPRLQINKTLKTSPNQHPLPLGPLYGDDRFNPSGHGDVYYTLNRSGVLQQLIDEGKTYVFISNSDNLGAIPDPNILSYLTKHDIPFLIEVTERTQNDIKGGTVVKYRDPSGDFRIKLLEMAQVDPQHVEAFQSIEDFTVFNTNNVWVNLLALQKQLQAGELRMDLIVNPKCIRKQNVLQLENAMGSAISSFPGARALVVSRKRFFPVKSTNELFLVRSDLFVFEGGEFRLKPEHAKRSRKLPLIQLSSFFKDIYDFEQRVAQVPDISKLDSLTIEGNVYFEPGVRLAGHVSILAGDKKIVISKGSLLMNDTLRF